MKTLRSQPRTRGSRISPTRTTDAPFSPHPDRSGEIRLNGARPPCAGTDAVFGVRREISRFHEDPTRSAPGPGGRVFPPPPRAKYAPFSPNSDRSREIRLNGANPTARVAETVFGIPRRISRFPECHMRPKPDQGGRIFRPPPRTAQAQFSSNSDRSREIRVTAQTRGADVAGRDLLGDAADRGRLLTGDFERDPVNPPDGTSPQSTVAGRYFHLGQSVFGGVRNLGLPGEFGKDGDIELLVKKLSATAFSPVNKRPWRTRNFRRSSRATSRRFSPTSNQHIGAMARRRATPALRTRMAERGVATTDLEPQGEKRRSSTTRSPALSRRPTAPTWPASANRNICRRI